MGKLGVRTGKITLTTKAGTETIIKGRKYRKRRDCLYLYVNRRDFLEKIGFTIRRKNK